MIRNEKNTAKGFALVATLTLMVLLALIAVGLLSLSTVTLRSSSQNQAMLEARANARMALMMAIGELQKELGPDQRISANGAILGDPASASDSSIAHPHWTGVWNSWKAGEGESSQHSTIGDTADADMHPSYDPPSKRGRSDYFRSWLVSLPESVGTNPDHAKSLALDASLMPSLAEDAVILVSEGSLGKNANSNDQVKVPLVTINDNGSELGTGRYGWWVGDESQKARIMADSYESTTALTDANKIFRSQAPGSMGNTTVAGLEGMTDEQQLGSLPSLKTLDLVSVSPAPADGDPMVSQLNFHHATLYSNGVLADVREGGLKRDLSTLLERPIARSEDSDEFMLYEFDDPRFPDRANSRVPIQDLAAYYQLYNDIKPTDATFGDAGREGVRYSSTQLANSIQTNVPDYDGGTKDRQRILREYTALYKQPVVAKLQFILGVSSEEITPQDRAIIQGQVDGTIKVAVGPDQTHSNATMPVPADDTHKLIMGIMPMVTLWNPTNLPLVMVDKQVLRFKSPPPVIVKWKKYDGGPSSTFETTTDFGLTFLTVGQQTWQMDGRDAGYDFMALRLQGDAGKPIVFGPGEVKIFTLPESSFGNSLTELGDANTVGGVTNTVNTPYNPNNFVKLWHSHTYSKSYNPHVFVFTDSVGKKRKSCLVFNSNDRFSLSVDHDRAPTNYADPRTVASKAQLNGAGFGFSLTDAAYYSTDTRYTPTFLEHYVMTSRHGGGTSAGDPTHARMATFNEQLITPGFPGGSTPLDFKSYTNAIKGDDLIGAGQTGEVKGLFDFSLSLGCESGSLSAGGLGGGRRITSRPFLHSGIGTPPFIDQSGKEWLYNYGWDWQIGTPNDVEDSIVTAKPASDNGYFGGGYTIEAGTTHVVQREIPVLPSISIASLSHAQLGGYSLAYAVNYDGMDPATGMLTVYTGQMSRPTGIDFQRTTAVGHGGLAPQVSQAIGNSYAHPNIPANKAFTTKTRRFDEDPGEGDKVVPFVDHSYLANKALWDEFYFSSIAPQPSKVSLFGGTGLTAKMVADQFFRLNSPLTSTPLPNRRIIPYKTNLDQAKLDALYAEASVYTNGLADKISAHLMVEGAFNVNSTSVEAWKVFLSSLKGKPVAYLDGGTEPKEATPEGTSISPGSLPNGVPVKSTDITDINSPEDQWTTGRELTDDEINELAVAMVKQVKLRGPFLSMSEFVNRRLTSPGTDGMALKGALQAALDDPAVSINAQFRAPERLLDTETSGISFDFPDAAKGPIAYGSQPYVDQADVLRGFAEQLTPRGDTFIIRTYGDSLDANGNVAARAWCEAVVQRVPEYVNSADAPHLKQADPALSAQSKQFGRKIQIVRFRWINPSEI